MHLGSSAASRASPSCGSQVAAKCGLTFSSDLEGFGFAQVARAILLLALAGGAMPGPRAAPIISEFMASNATTSTDEDGACSDWIELHNPDATPVSLGGWYLSDTATNRTKWQFPEVIVPAGGYLVVWASSKNRRDPARPLHTNFALSAGGEFLGLTAPDGVTMVSAYAPTYPPQRDDVSYGISRTGAAVPGYFLQPTPGRENGATSGGALAEKVTFSRSSGLFIGSLTLELAGAGPGQRIRYVTSSASVAAFNVPAPTAAATEYTGPLTITASTVIRAAVFSNNNALSGPVTSAHFLPLDASLAAFGSTMPVLVLDNLGAGPLVKDGIDHPTWLYAYAPRAPGFTPLATTPDVATPLTSTVRGQTAASFPKKPFNLKFTDESGAKRSQAFLGSAAYEKWALIAPWYFDRTFIHNALAYALSNRIGRWAPRTWLTEVFCNTGSRLYSDDYYGVCVLTDRIELGAGRVEITPLSGSDTGGGAVTGGYILKIDVRDDDEYGFVTEHAIPEDADTNVVVAYPKDADLVAAQRDYIRGYVQAMENTLYADAAGGWKSRAYLDYIDRASWVDHHLLNTLAANPDAFRRSAYFTKNRHGRIAAGPLWDFDRAFNSIDSRNVGWEGWRGDADGVGSVWDWGWWKTLCRDPEFRQDWIDRWQALRRDEFTNENLAAQIDTLAAQVGRDAAARDAARWPENASRYGDYDGEITQLKNWLTNRAAWIDRQFVAAPAIARHGETLWVTPAEGTQLAYTLDGSDPRSLGGGVAPNATLSGEPIAVSADANLHVRSYDPTLSDGFPGTPWSSACGGDASTPLTPVARVINASARGQVRSGDAAFTVRFAVTDTQAKRILARAVGPGLAAFGETGLVSAPRFVWSNADGAEVCRNEGWDVTDGAAMALMFQSVGAFPLAAGSTDAAATATVCGGEYTLIIRSDNGAAGTALAELYPLDSNGRITRLVLTGALPSAADVLVVGFVLQGAAGQRVLIRTEAAMSAKGSAGSRNEITLYAGSDQVATNERWSVAANAEQIAATCRLLGQGALARGDGEPAALFVTLPPGAYTAVVRAKDQGERIVSLGLYEVP